MLIDIHHTGNKTRIGRRHAGFRPQTFKDSKGSLIRGIVILIIIVALIALVGVTVMVL
jgi:hypothetical protein